MGGGGGGALPVQYLKNIGPAIEKSDWLILDIQALLPSLGGGPTEVAKGRVTRKVALLY